MSDKELGNTPQRPVLLLNDAEIPLHDADEVTARLKVVDLDQFKNYLETVVRAER